MTTLIGERAEGTKMVYVYELTDKGKIADGTTRTMQTISINTVVIGGHGVYNATAFVVADGTMMLVGYGVLNQVSPSFAINTAKSTLEFN